MAKPEKQVNGAPWHEVRQSTLHGNGVFALRDIPAGTKIIEYTGKRITPEQADAMFPVNPDDPFHTFFFSLSSGKIIDGGQRGNDARWINHSCDPNCETQEGRHGKRVYVFAKRDIKAGEELFYDYGLVIDDKLTAKLKKQYQCLCGSENCRGTMLALPEKKKTVKKATAKKKPADPA
ncbi:MAG: SET domain-containing protein-lysine N-methyltransferase [Advenella sp.]|uniref:SET domain-containing protein n=1 Tax=Advenella sp. TaxID=1872388 RepID=UPI00258E482F|nr:SET domain-containing protein-lysine N-methyltransferase [Advenella sp.]MDD3758327.1 SET domain-containing protein-lysine N-methyltransferase [Advenella sp.]